MKNPSLLVCYELIPQFEKEMRLEVEVYLSWDYGSRRRFLCFA